MTVIGGCGTTGNDHHSLQLLLHNKSAGQTQDGFYCEADNEDLRLLGVSFVDSVIFRVFQTSGQKH